MDVDEAMIDLLPNEKIIEDEQVSDDMDVDEEMYDFILVENIPVGEQMPQYMDVDEEMTDVPTGENIIEVLHGDETVSFSTHTIITARTSYTVSRTFTRCWNLNQPGV